MHARGDVAYVEDDLVKELEGVAQEHQRHDPEIDSSAQGRDVNRVSAAGIMLVILEILPRSVDV